MLTDSFSSEMAFHYDTSNDDSDNPTIQYLYDEFYKECVMQYAALPETVKVAFVSVDPYKGYSEMERDLIDNRVLKVWTGGNPHPILTTFQNCVFRTVHDFYGHYLTRSDFSYEGEEVAYQTHKKMFPKHLWGILATETRLQNAWLRHYGHGTKFPEQKAIIAPAWAL